MSNSIDGVAQQPSLDTIAGGSGTHFDPVVVDALTRIEVQTAAVQSITSSSAPLM